MPASAARRAARAERLRVLNGTYGEGTRGTRLAARLAGGALPRFDDLRTVPAWRLVPEARADALAMAAALLYHRPQIDRSLDGGSLRSVAARASEALFDAACEAPVHDLAASTVSALPHANQFGDIGLSLIRRAEREPGDVIARLLDRAAALIEPPAR